MKRIGNIYQKLCCVETINKVYQELMKTTRNKRKVTIFNQYRCIYIHKIYRCMIERSYFPKKLREVTIYEPKKRVIVVQDIFDKIIDHLISREILIPYLTKGLIDSNVASRKGYGVKKGRTLYFQYRSSCCQKYFKYYLLKIDISKFFSSIDHEILKKKIKDRIKDKDVLILLGKIIDNYDKGIPIGLMTSQIFAIYYLDSLDKYIKEELKIKYYVRYQDDMVLLHPDKQYLQYCLKCIKIELRKLGMSVNHKTRIYSNKDNMNFIGVKKNGKLSNYRRTVCKVNKSIKEYYDGKRELSSVLTSLNYIGRK